MTTPIVEHIAEDIRTTIEAISAPTYNQNLKAIRPRRNDFSDVPPVNGTCLIEQADEEEGEDAIGFESWVQPFVIWAIVIDSDKETDSIDTRLNQVKCDIIKALLVDHTRGGYATDTKIRPSAKFDDGEGFTGIAVRIDVAYFHKHNNPYSKT